MAQRVSLIAALVLLVVSAVVLPRYGVLAQANSPPSVTGSVSPEPSKKSDRVLAFGDTYVSVEGASVGETLKLTGESCEATSDPVGIVQQAGNAATAATSVVATYPGATTVNNLLVAVYTKRDGTVGPSDTPSGWSEAVTANNAIADGSWTGLYYKIATGSETTVHFDTVAAEEMALLIYEVEGLLTTAVLDTVASVSQVTDATNHPVGPTPKLTSDHQWVLAALSIDRGDTVNPLYSWTNTFAFLNPDQTAAGAAGIQLEAAHRKVSTGGAVATREQTSVGETSTGVIATFRIKTNCVSGSSGGVASSEQRVISHIDAASEDLAVAQDVVSGGTCDDPQFDCETVHNSAERSSIAIAPNGGIWVAYIEPISDDVYIAEYTKGEGSDCTSSDWTCTRVEITTAQEIHLAIGNDGTKWISFEDRSGADGALAVAHTIGGGGMTCTNTAWDCESVDVTDDVGRMNAIITDQNGMPWVSAVDATNGRLVVSRRDGGAGADCGGAVDPDWSCEDVDITGVGLQFTDIAIDPTTNIPWVIYYDSITDAATVARRDGGGTGNCSNTQWNCENVEAGSMGVEGLGIDVATDGTVWISFHDDSVAQDLWAARRPKSTTLDRQITVGTDDGQVDTALGAFSSTLNPGVGDVFTFAKWNAWYRFPNMTIPQGTTIDVAYITQTRTFQGGTTVLTNIFGIAEDDHVAPTTLAEWTIDNGLATASTAWNFTSATPGTHNTPDISPVIQEIVNRGGWASGQAMGIHINDNLSGAFDYQEWDDVEGTTAATLHIEYSSGGGNCDSANWTCWTVDSGGDVGEHARISVASNDVPWISYHDATNNSLKVARFSSGSGCNDAAWTCTTALSPSGMEDFGTYTSIDHGNTNPLVFRDSFTGGGGIPVPLNAAKWAIDDINGATSVVDTNEGKLTVIAFVDSAARARAIDADHTDAELLVNWRKGSTTADGTLRFILRGSDSWADADDPVSGYAVTINGNNATVSLDAISAGVSTPINSFTYVNETDLNTLRFRVEGERIKVKMWEPLAEQEPISWDLDETDATIGSGTLQINAYRASGGSHDYYIDNLSLITLVSKPVVSTCGGVNGDFWNQTHWVITEGNGSGTYASNTDGTADIQGNECHARAAATADGNIRAIATNGEHTDAEILTSVWFGGTGATATLSMFLRASGDWATDALPTFGYEVRRSTGSGTAEVFAVTGGSASSLGTFVWANDTNEWWVRFQVQADNIRVRVWQKGTNEPGAWTFAVNNSAIAGPGLMQLAWDRDLGGPWDVYFDAMEIIDLTGGGPLISPQGTIESLTIDTRSPNGVAFNTLLWNGTKPAGSSVRFWLATSNCPNGETDPPDCTTPADPRIDERFTGVDNDPWSSQRWTTSVVSGGVAEIEFNQGNLEHSLTAESAARAIATMPQIADSEVLTRFRFASTAGRSDIRLFLRSSGDWTGSGNARPDSAYEFVVQNSDDVAKIYSITGGVRSGMPLATYDTLNATMGANQWWWVRFQVDDDDIRVRLWKAGYPEPTTWQMEVLDDMTVSGTGVFQLATIETDPGGNSAEETYFDELKLRNLDVASAADDDVASQWQFYGENCTINLSPYEPAPGITVEFPLGCEDGNGNAVFFNRRYFRYKVELCLNSDCVSGGSTPTITDVSINWSQ